MKRIILITCYILICFTACSQTDKTPLIRKNYPNPTPGEITILASTPIPDGMLPTRDAYEDLIDCGFNVALTDGNKVEVCKQFSMIRGLDLKFLLTNSRLRSENYMDYITAFKDEPQLAGWRLVDEPRFNQLKELKEAYKRLMEADSTHLIYINLVGANIAKFSGPSKTYKDYLNLINSTFKPKLWSYDLYPFAIRNGELKIGYDTFYSDLELFRDMQNETGYPFWAYCQSMAFKNNAVERPAATLPFLRFEAFSALAYGAQGLVYWTYGQRYSSEYEEYFSALINLDGTKSKAWYDAQKVNREIKKFNNVFYQCMVKEVFHTGEIYPGTKRLKGGIGPFSKIKSGKDGILVSYLSSNEKNYIVIVNHSVEKSQKLNFILKPGRQVRLISSSNEMCYNSSIFSLKVDKGSYLIFQEI